MSSPVPKAIAEQACTISLTSNTLTIQCSSRDEAEELMDWLCDLPDAAPVTESEDTPPWTDESCARVQVYTPPRACTLCESPHGDCLINGLVCCVDCGQAILDEEARQEAERRRADRRPWS